MWGLARRLFARGRRCPSCGRICPKDGLAFKRFLSRREAELLEKTSPLRSHFVYACPHCGGDLLDTTFAGKASPGLKV